MALWNMKGKSVLIIDDFSQMRSMLRSMLQPYTPSDIKQASNGEEAIDIMVNNRFDLVLCDYNLGEGKDGQQVLEEAKHRKLLPYTTVFVMVTAENTNAMVMGAVEYQPDAYLSKPINKTVLVSRLEKLMYKKEQLKGLSDALEQGSLEQGVKCCDDLLGRDVKYRLEILKIKSELLLDLEKYDEAKEICNQVLESRDIPWAMMVIGKVHFYNQEYDEAAEIFQKIIDTNKTYMAAYDWLAKIMDKQGNHGESQDVLTSALVQSPKSLLRQRALANVADKNQDYAVTEKARKQVINIGKTSCLKESNDYTKLAKVLVTNNSADEALKVLDKTKHMFKGDEKAALESTVELGLVYKSMGKQEMYEKAVDKALEIAKKDPALANGETAMDLAKSCMALGKTEDADLLVKSVVKEFHDDDEMIGKINEMYKESGKGAEGEKLISMARKEVIETNNRGVKLMSDGEVEEAVKLFMQAAKEMPENITINLNTAKSLIAHMQKKGFNRRQQSEANKYLDVVFKSDPDNNKARELQSLCRNLASQ